MQINSRISSNFFDQPTLIVAKKLLGKILVFNNYYGIINETEAYIGTNDPACHAAKGRTKRTEIMYGSSGHTYVYMIYGMYYCLNIVTERVNFPAAVLLRGLILPNQQILDGPGKLCKYLGINIQHNNINLNVANNFYIYDPKLPITKLQYLQTPRIGIKVGLDKLWRFKLINSELWNLNAE